MEGVAGALAGLLTLVLSLLFTFGPLLLFFVVGRVIEKRHERSLREREARLAHVVVTNLKELPAGVVAHESRLVLGDVVIAPDHFKTWAAGLKTLVGGRLETLVTLMERARRESLLRMKQEADRMGASFVINVRFETANLRRVSNNGGQQQGAAIVEMLCYATAVVVPPENRVTS